MKKRLIKGGFIVLMAALLLTGLLLAGCSTPDDGITDKGIITVDGKTLTGIAVTTNPTKTEYNLNEELSTTGMVVTATYSDNTTAAVTGYTVSGFSSSAEGTKTVTVTYEGKTAAFTVTVIDPNKTVATPTADPGEGTYTTAQSVNLTTTTEGAAIYYTINGTDPTTASTQYSAGTPISISETTTLKAFAVKEGMNDSQILTQVYTINIGGNTKTLTGIEVTTLPAKIQYNLGEDIVLTGMVVTATYSDDTTEAVTGYTVSGYDKTKTGNHTITVTYGGETASFTVNVINPNLPTVATPAASIEEGTYNAAQTVTLTSTTADAKIYYTLDGEEPTKDSTQYSTAISVSVTTTIKAIAVKDAHNDSGILTAAYTLQVLAPAADIAAGEILKGTEVTLTTATEGAEIWYTTGDSEPAKNGAGSVKYTAKIAINETATIKAIAVKDGWENSETLTVTYTVPKAATPAISPPAGTYGKAQSVTLSTTTEGAAIYYTLDGTTPTTASTQYSTAIIVSETTTIKAFAVKDGHNDSDILTAAYNIIIEMVTVPAGTFTMGSPATETGRNANETQHQVTLTKSFYMGKYQVTQAQYQAVMNNPSGFNGSTGKEPADGEIQVNRPVEQVRWYDIIAFCNKLSMKEGLDPVYSLNGSTDPAVWGEIPTSNNVTWNTVVMDISKNGYRLPTEAEWEYACRAGTTTTFNNGINDPNDTSVGDVAWYGNATNAATGNSASKTHEVGLKTPNAWGLYDMHGNVFEWCWDWFDTNYYASSPKANPLGASSGTVRVLRGGSFDRFPGTDLRSARRGTVAPENRSSAFGFRLARTVVNPSLPAAVTPVASPAAGNYETEQSVTLSTATQGAAIYYTLDGTNPPISSTLYTGPISIVATTTLKAVAVKEGMNDSAVLTATYTIFTPFTSAPALTLVADDTKITYSWTASNPAADSYDVYWAAGSGLTAAQVKAGTKIPGTTSGGSITGLTNGTTYSVIVTANKAGYASIDSAVGTATPVSAFYVIQGITSFTATKGGATVGTANQSIQDVINAIRTDATGKDPIIQFGDGTAVLDIGTASANFNTTGGNWGKITLRGKITSAVTGTTSGTVAVTSSNIGVTSGADITNTGSNGVAVYNSSNSTVTISGGTVSATTGYAAYNGSTGTVTISGGTVSATTGYAAYNNNTGKITVSETALVTSANVTATSGTIYLANNGNATAARLEITGGRVENTGANNDSRTIYNASPGAVNISGGTVSVTTGCTIYNNSTGAVNVSGGTVSATSTTGRAIYNNSNGKITVSQPAGATTNITSEVATGGTIYLDYATGGSTSTAVRLEITGGTVANTNNSGYGGAVFNSSPGAVTISGGTVSATTGRTVNNNYTGALTISGGTVSATGGQAVYNNDTGTVNISGGTVTLTQWDQSSLTRCAVYNNSTGPVNISGGTVSAQYNTYAVYNNTTGKITVSGATTKITSPNNAAAQGTIYLKNDGSNTATRLEITGGTIENTSTTTGNAIRNDSSGGVNITGGTVSKAGSGDYAVYKGGTGSVYIGTGATIVVNNYGL